MEDIRIGDYIETWNCVKFYPLDPRPEEIVLEDIAISLSRQCRYLGHIDYHYSIAQHCVLLHDYIEAPHKKQMLMHDGSEAYLCDIPRPIKPLLTNYKEIEYKLQTMIYQKYGIDIVEHPRVSDLDRRIVLDEKKALKSKSDTVWNIPGGPLGIEVVQWSQARAYDEFMSRAKLYF